MRELWSCKYQPSRTVKNVGIDQMKLLVARNQGRCQEICSRMFQIPTKQSTTPKENRRITPIGNTGGPWQEISINIIGPLPKLNGKDAIVVIVDRFTKMVRLKATMTNISSEEITKVYQDEIWKLHGIPRKILSDRGPQFVLRFMEKFTKTLETTRQLLTAYYPQTYGQMERINQEVGTFLQHYVNYQQDDWMEWLAAAEFLYNNKKHATIGQTPSELNFGIHPWKGNLMVQTEFPKLEEFLIELQRSWEEATKSIEIVQEAIKKQFNKKRRNPQGWRLETIYS